MDQQRRLLLAIGLSFAVTLVYTNFFVSPPAPAGVDGGVAQALVDAGAAAAPVVASPVPSEVADAGVAPFVAEQRSVEVQRPSMALTFTTAGAGLTDAVLKGNRERESRSLSIPDGYRKLLGARFEPPPHIDMAEPPPAGPPQLAVSITGPTPVPPTQPYEVVEEAEGRVTFRTVSGPFEVVKTFTWAPGAGTSETDPSGYLSTLAVTVRNTSAVAAGGALQVHAVRGIDPAQEEAPSMFGGIGNQASVLCKHDDDVTRKLPDADEPDEAKQGQLSFVGIDQQYFLTAVWPAGGARAGDCQLHADPTLRTATLSVPLTVAAGAEVTETFGVFLGPKDLTLLNAVGAPPSGPAPSFDPRLEDTVDFGWWAVIAKGLVVLMRVFHGMTGNWGVAIILLTLLVKVVLLPLTHRAMVSAEQMKKLAPRMEDIRKKFPDDREKQNMEMMKLYQEAKVNPLGGCLPLLLQLPIWAALFTTLRTSYELYQEPFFGVWSDLTSKDPTYLLPLLLGVTMIVTQRLQPQMTMDKTQAAIFTWVMPVMFTAVMLNYPAGLALYIFTNNLLSIGQQYALRKYLERTGQAQRPVGVTR